LQLTNAVQLFPDRNDGFVVAHGLRDHDRNAGFLYRLANGAALCQVEGSGLFQEHGFPAIGRDLHHLRVKDGGYDRDHRVHVRSGEELPVIAVGGRAELLGLRGRLVSIAPREPRQPRVRHVFNQVLGVSRAVAPHPNDADAQAGLCHEPFQKSEVEFRSCGVDLIIRSMTTPLLAFENVSRTFASNSAPRTALDNVSFQLEPGETVALMGRSGSGKSTLLHLAAGIDTPTQGRVFLDGEDLMALDDTRRTMLRRNRVGIVFQFFHLLPHLSVAENVALPDWIAGGRGMSSRVMELLERVGLTDRARDPVERLSGGEMQRVAICRALLRQPGLLLADEPTGNLDEESGGVVLDLLFAMAAETGATVLIATHSSEIAQRAYRVWRLRDGLLLVT